MAIKWKQIWGLLDGLWNSTALWSQISCPLHLSIQGYWFLCRFNLLSEVWLVMIYWDPLFFERNLKTIFLMNYLFILRPFHVWILKIHRLWPHPLERSLLCPLVISGNWRNMLSPHHSKSVKHRSSTQEALSWKGRLTGDNCSDWKVFAGDWLISTNACILNIPW